MKTRIRTCLTVPDGRRRDSPPRRPGTCVASVFRHYQVIIVGLQTSAGGQQHLKARPPSLALPGVGRLEGRHGLGVEGSCAERSVDVLYFSVSCIANQGQNGPYDPYSSECLVFSLCSLQIDPVMRYRTVSGGWRCQDLADKQGPRIPTCRFNLKHAPMRNKQIQSLDPPTM
jgi:hypothetical protein